MACEEINRAEQARMRGVWVCGGEGELFNEDVDGLVEVEDECVRAEHVHAVSQNGCVSSFQHKREMDRATNRRDRSPSGTGKVSMSG